MISRKPYILDEKQSLIYPTAAEIK